MVLSEPSEKISERIWNSGHAHIAWDWLRVEAESACVRRKARHLDWSNYRKLISEFTFVSLNPEEHEHLLMFNRSLGLRSADAGHLFLASLFFRDHFDSFLVTFDKEMIEAAQKLALPLHPLCLES